MGVGLVLVVVVMVIMVLVMVLVMIVMMMVVVVMMVMKVMVMMMKQVYSYYPVSFEHLLWAVLLFACFSVFSIPILLFFPIVLGSVALI